MRLESFEIEAIKLSINRFINHDNYLLYLFGSRIDHNKKGGDIDLLLVIKDQVSTTKDAVLGLKHKILVEIKYTIGDQKIDLVIAEERDLLAEPFLREIMKMAVKL